MIAHAWTVVCDRSMLDRDSNNMSLDTIELIYVHKADDGIPALVPCHLEVVSLWYRQDPRHGGRHRATIRVLSPALIKLADFPIDVDLHACQRYRTRCVIEGLLVERPGTYLFTLDLLDTVSPVEVARVPFQVEFTGP